jgi:uncharacterized membrane protein YhaH (DUF805 family)
LIAPERSGNIISGHGPGRAINGGSHMEWMFMPLKRYAEFGGRSRPMEFWMFFVLQLILYTVLLTATFVVAGGIAGLSSIGNNGSAAASGLVGMFATLGIFALVLGLVYLALLVPNLAVSSRRLHDTGKSGWWQLIYWVPWLLGMVVSFMNMGSPSSGLAGVSLIFSGLQMIGLIVLIVFYVLPGTPGPNQYGPSPMGNPGGYPAQAY